MEVNLDWPIVQSHSIYSRAMIMVPMRKPGYSGAYAPKRFGRRLGPCRGVDASSAHIGWWAVIAVERFECGDDVTGSYLSLRVRDLA